MKKSLFVLIITLLLLAGCEKEPFEGISFSKVEVVGNEIAVVVPNVTAVLVHNRVPMGNPNSPVLVVCSEIDYTDDGYAATVILTAEVKGVSIVGLQQNTTLRTAPIPLTDLVYLASRDLIENLRIARH